MLHFPESTAGRNREVARLLPVLCMGIDACLAATKVAGQWWKDRFF